MNIPPDVEYLITRLQSRGFQAHIVGGCVRDSLMGLTPHDWDITTDARPEEIKSCFSGERCIDTGIAHGTVTVLAGGIPYEITTYRVDGAYSDGRRPDSVCFTGSLSADLARRDFTMNAVAFSPETGLTDLYGGAADIENKLIRTVGDASERFNEDALRILRALRFASTLGFSIDKLTADAIHRERGLLLRISAERIFAEFKRLLCGRSAMCVLREFYDVIAVVIPEIVPMIGFEQNTPWHIYDVYEHTLCAVSEAEQDETLRLIMFFHDIGKPSCYSVDSKGCGHFHGHERISRDMTEKILKRLRCDRATLDCVCTIIGMHDHPRCEGSVEECMKTLCRVCADIGYDNTVRLLKARRADNAAQSPERAKPGEYFDALLSRLASLKAAGGCMSLHELKINGDDLARLGIEPSKRTGELLHELLYAVIDGECENEREALLARAKSKRTAYEV